MTDLDIYRWIAAAAEHAPDISIVRATSEPAVGAWWVVMTARGEATLSCTSVELAAARMSAANAAPWMRLVAAQQAGRRVEDAARAAADHIQDIPLIFGGGQ